MARQAKNSAQLRASIRHLLQVAKVCPVDDSILNAALDLPFADYEDAVQHCCATAEGLEGIVTRNIRDYKNATLPVFTPSEFIQHLKSQQT